MAGTAARATSRTRAGCALAGLLSAALIVASWQEWLDLPLNRTEVLAFVSGTWTVWLAARNNLWTWPVGVLNSAFFGALFWEARLYFDMGLNVFYVLSGLWGWWVWARGGPRRTEQPVGRVGRCEAAGLLLGGAVLTAAMWHGGVLIEDAAPFFDAATTALSLAAQWLLMRRLIENWFAWIAADLIYVPLYLSRGLPLTALLYAIFLLMCLQGLRRWRSLLPPRPSAVSGALV